MKNSSGEDTREGVYVSSAEDHELAGSKGSANFVIKWVRDARTQANLNVIEEMKKTSFAYTGRFRTLRQLASEPEPGSCTCYEFSPSRPADKWTFAALQLRTKANLHPSLLSSAEASIRSIGDPRCASCEPSCSPWRASHCGLLIEPLPLFKGCGCHRQGGFIVTSTRGKVFRDADFSDKEWMDVDEDTGESVSVMELEWKFETRR